MPQLDRVRLPPIIIHDRIAAADATVRPWSIDQTGIRTLGKQRGQGVKVLVVDTGLASHPALERVRKCRDFTGSRRGWQDMLGHGTHVTGTIGGCETSDGGVGVAPGVELLIAKGLGDDGTGGPGGIAESIYWGLEEGAHLINLSLGSPQRSDEIMRAIHTAWAAGVMTVCAAGNFGDQATSWPALDEKTVSVAATDIQGKAASFSEPSAVNVAAPGVKILSSYLNGQYGLLSGTSMASPWVTGFIAIYLGELLAAGKPLPPPAKLFDLLGEWADDIHAPGHDRKTGHGLVSVERYKATAPKPDPEVAPPGKQIKLGPIVIHRPAVAGDTFSVGLAQ